MILRIILTVFSLIALVRGGDNYEDLFENGANPIEKNLMDWLFSERFQHTGATIQKDFGSSGRGMVFTRDVQKHDELFAVPISTILYTSNPNLSRGTKDALESIRGMMRSPAFTALSMELTEMGIVTLFEKLNQKSFWFPYLNTLQHPWCPGTATEEEWQAIEYNWLGEWRNYFMEDSIKNFATWCDEAQDEAREPINLLVEFKRASSEEFAGMNEVELLPLLVADFKWSVSTVLQRSFDWGPDSRREYMMVPYMDMINHRFNITNAYYFSQDYIVVPPDYEQAAEDHEEVSLDIAPSMVMASGHDHKAGDEVLITYSYSAPNTQLLLQYGFIVPDNGHDYVTLMFAVPETDKYMEVGMRYGYDVTLVRVDHGDYSVPLELVHLVSRIVVPSGTDRNLGKLRAYQFIKQQLQRELDSFSTTLQEDEEIKQAGGLSRALTQAVAYRIECKTFIGHMINRLDMDIAYVEYTMDPFGVDSEDAPPKPHAARMIDHSAVHDWPLRQIALDFSEFAGYQQFHSEPHVKDEL